MRGKAWEYKEIYKHENEEKWKNENESEQLRKERQNR